MNKLYRSRKSSMIAGVCGGLGNYLGIDPTIIRLVFVFLAFYHFLGAWVYLVMVILLPQAPPDQDVMHTSGALSEHTQTTKVIGGGLVLLGMLALVSMLNLPLFSWLRLENIWPILIVLLGVLLLARAFISEE